MSDDRPLSPPKALLWILCLAFLAVGARNFEPGLSGDGPLYAAIGRQVARSHEWFSLYGGVPDFVPYAEHPHLGFWVLALVFKVLPAADWTARMVSHLFYVGFLLMLFLYVRRVSDEKVAVWTVLLLWIWYPFSNFFSNAYLDPGALFFGSAAVLLWEKALQEGRVSLGALSGLSLALCALYKGLTVLGFLPAWAALAAWYRPRREDLGRLAREVGVAGGVAAAGILLYSLALHYSQVPDFFARYWRAQMSGRVERVWNWGAVLKPRFWISLLQCTYFLPLAAFGTFLPGRPRRHLLLPAALFFTFVCMYAPAGKVGAQYVLMLLPWLAWLAAEGGLARIPVRSALLVRGSAGLALAAVCLLQYGPFRTHRVEPPAETAELARLRVRQLVLERAPIPPEFIFSAPFAWYGDLQVEYGNPRGEPVPASPGRAYLLAGNMSERAKTLARRGWCLHLTYPASTLWMACPTALPRPPG